MQPGVIKYVWPCFNQINALLYATKPRQSRTNSLDSMMKSTFLAIVFLLFDTTVKADQGKNSGRSSSMAKEATNYVVNHEFCHSCLNDEYYKEKESLNDVNTYAQLYKDPRAELPSSFTICSSVMTTYYKTQLFNLLMLFNLLGNDGNRWLGLSFQVDDNKTSFYHVSMFLRKVHFFVYPILAQNGLFLVLRGQFWPKTSKI